MLPENIEREKKERYVENKQTIPMELFEDFKQALMWVKSIQSTNYWNDMTKVVFTCDIDYAIRRAQKVFVEANQEIIGMYSGRDGKVHPDAILALFHKHEKNPTDRVREHIVFKSVSGSAKSMKQVLGSLNKVGY
jgi:hypothetical protein